MLYTCRLIHVLAEPGVAAGSGADVVEDGRAGQLVVPQVLEPRVLQRALRGRPRFHLSDVGNFAVCVVINCDL